MVANAAAGPPSKWYREEARVDAVQCPSCGGPLTRSGFGAIAKVVCPYCGSELSPADNGALAILQEVRRQQRQSMLPLHARCTLEGLPWELIGIVWREVEAEGSVYPWQEFLLFNPYHGYRYLLYFVYDGHFALGRPLDGAPKLDAAFGRKRASWKKSHFKHFQSSLARTTYVEGEFPWEVRVGDMAVAHDYVDPPRGLSVEENPGTDGADITYTEMQHLEGAEVWKAFGMKGNPPRAHGIGPFRPNPWRRGRGLTWASMLVLGALWVLLSIVYSAARDDEIVFEKSGLPFEPFIEEITIGKSDETSTVEVEFWASPLSNSWAYADIVLVPHETDEAIGVGLEVDEWHGVDGGESWQEGSSRNDTVLGGVKSGVYTLQVTPQAGAGTGTTPPPELRWGIRVRRDVVMARYILLSFLVIVGFPLLLGIFSLVIESQRWKNSDYAPSS
ncbi:MAG TPA: DUF4178 domain-containing protein [Nannocystaceae bacterium]|nr:DUF4178 domain-containing protein [Nannocystaceae bacterium]